MRAVYVCGCSGAAATTAFSTPSTPFNPGSEGLPPRCIAIAIELILLKRGACTPGEEPGCNLGAPLPELLTLPLPCTAGRDPGSPSVAALLTSRADFKAIGRGDGLGCKAVAVTDVEAAAAAPWATASIAGGSSAAAAACGACSAPITWTSVLLL